MEFKEKIIEICKKIHYDIPIFLCIMNFYSYINNAYSLNAMMLINVILVFIFSILITVQLKYNLTYND